MVGGKKLEEIAEEAAETMESFIHSLDVPTRLRDVGAKEDELHIVAEEVIKESSMWHDYKGGQEAFLGLLRQMW